MKLWFLLQLVIIFSIHTCLNMEETERMLNVVHHHTAFVSKVSIESSTPHKTKISLCECYNATELIPSEIECR